MAFTYLILNLVFMACVLILTIKKLTSPSRAWWITLFVILFLTLIFDSLIIWAGIVGYDTTKILGLYIGYAPVEDFFYALLVCILVPMFWHQFEPTVQKVAKK